MTDTSLFRESRPILPEEVPATIAIAADDAVVPLDVERSAAWRTRKKFLSYETTVRALSVVMAVVGMLVWVGVAITFSGLIGVPPSGQLSETIAMFVLAGLALTITAIELWRFRNWRRYPTILFGLAGLTQFPAGLLVSIVAILTMISRSSGFVFSDEYREVRRDTPELRCNPMKIIGLSALILVVILAQLTMSNPFAL